MPTKPKGGRGFVQPKGVRADNAPSLVSGPTTRALKRAPQGQSAKAARAPNQPSKSPSRPLDDNHVQPVTGSSLYGASWVAPSSALVSSLSEDEALLLRGLSPGSTSAQWYRSLNQQLSRRAADGVTDQLDRRPASANAALVIPLDLIATPQRAVADPSPSAPVSPPSVQRRRSSSQKVAPPAPVEADDSTYERLSSAVSSSSSHASSPSQDPSASVEEPSHPTYPHQVDDEELPDWLRETDVAPLPTAVRSTTPPPPVTSARRRTDLDRLQSLRRMMDVNNKAADTFSSSSLVSGDVASSRLGERHDKGSAKPKSHHLPPLPPPARSHDENTTAVEIAMSHTSESSFLRGRPSAYSDHASDSDDDRVQCEAPTAPVATGNARDLRAAHPDVQTEPLSSGRVVVLSLGNAFPPNTPAADATPVAFGQPTHAVDGPFRGPPQRAAGVPPVERMAPGLREKRTKALLQAQKKKRALPPLS